MSIYPLKYISLKKIVNLVKVFACYYLSILLRKVIVLGNPYSLTTEPTNKCNLQCLECPTGNKSSTRTKGDIDFENYKNIIDEVKNFVIYQMIYFQGEPFLNPDFFKLIKYADQNKIITSTSTNGHFLSEENCHKIIQSGLKKILISLDGTNQKTYEKYRIGGDFEKVTKGIKTLLEVKKTTKSKFPFINLQFLVFKHNQHQIKEIKQLAKSLGVKLELKSAQVENFQANSELIPSIKKFSRYDNFFHIKSKLPSKCIRIWSTLVVSWEGKVVSCCFDKNLKHQFGNTRTQSVLDIWKSNEFNTFRKNILIHRKKILICSNCSEGLRINY